MVAACADVADAIITGLDAQTFMTWDETPRRYMPTNLELEESQGLQVYVIPGGSIQTAMSITKGNVQTDYAIYVLMWESLAGQMDLDIDPDEVDERTTLAESIRDYLLGTEFSTAVWCISAEFMNEGGGTLDLDAFIQKRAFLSLISLRLRAIE